jgi:hypothetical protein
MSERREQQEPSEATKQMLAELEALANAIRMASLDELISKWVPAVGEFITVTSTSLEAILVKFDALEIRIRALEDGDS